LFTDYEKHFIVNKERFYLIFIILMYSRYTINGKSGQKHKKVMVKKSHYRPGQALRVPGG